MEDSREFIYRVDAQNRIISANPEWFAFARENDADALDPSAVIGHLLWEFISDMETIHLFQILLSKVRHTHDSATVPYRCDSPDCRRFMELEVVPKSNAEVEFHSRILREESRTPVPLMEGKVARTQERLIMCSWCKKVEVSGRWMEVEEAIARLHLFEATNLPSISHSICRECADSLKQQLEARRKSKPLKS